MKKLVELGKDYSIKLKSQVTSFLSPDYIYIPLKNNKVNLKLNDKINKGSIIFNNVYSPISGDIVGVKECTLYNGKKDKCIVIHNDFKEKQNTRIAIRKKITNLTKEEIVSSLFNDKFKDIFNNLSIKKLIISGIDDEPYIANQIFIQKENTKIILEMIDALLTVFLGSEAIIALKNTDGENIESYNNYLGTYKNISLKLVDDLYLIGKEEFLIDYLHIKEDYLYLTASDIYELYSYIKKRKPLVEKYITITGNAISNPKVFNVKLGTKVIDLLLSNYDASILENDLYVNGLMQGDNIDVKDLIITEEFEGIVIMKKKEKQEYSCIKCGKCINICPISSNPMLAYKDKKNVPCLNCGLCTYICPSYINLRKYLREYSKSK
jgi:electron transport complex protein RnfC